MEENEQIYQETKTHTDSYKIPPISTGSLGNSLFECMRLDAATERKARERVKTELPIAIQAGVICLCLRGSGKFVINEQEYTVNQGDMMTVLPNTIISVLASSDDFLGYVIAANVKYMMTLKITNSVQSYVNISSHPVLHIREHEMNSLIEIGELLKRKRDEGDHPYVNEVLEHLLKILLYEILACYERQSESVVGVVGGKSRQNTICQEFLMLVERHAFEHRDVGFYADKLFITTKYLSVVVKKYTGRSPVEWIDRSVMLYARTLLSSSDMTVQQISAQLKFPNPSFFGQYFKRHEGCTPRQYRLKLM